MAVLVLENTGYTASIDTQGSKLLSFTEPSGKERIFQSENESEQSGAIFFTTPFNQSGGTPYNMLENARLEAVDVCKSSAIICLSSKDVNADIGFILTIKYMLESGSLITTYNIVNTDSRPLRYCIGSNFNLAYPAEKNSEYLLEFEHSEVAVTKYAHNMLHIWKDSMNIDSANVLCGDKLSLTSDMFDTDSMYFENPISRCIRAYNRTKNYGVQVYFKDFQSIGFYIGKATDSCNYLAVSPYTSYDERMDAIFGKSFLYLDSNANRLHTSRLMFY